MVNSHKHLGTMMMNIKNKTRRQTKIRCRIQTTSIVCSLSKYCLSSVYWGSNKNFIFLQVEREGYSKSWTHCGEITSAHSPCMIQFIMCSKNYRSNFFALAQGINLHLLFGSLRVKDSVFLWISIAVDVCKLETSQKRGQIVTDTKLREELHFKSQLRMY